MGEHDIIWGLASGAFALAWGLAAYFAKRDRLAIQHEMEQMAERVGGMGKSLDALRDEIRKLTLEHERRLVRIETLLGRQVDA